MGAGSPNASAVTALSRATLRDNALFNYTVTYRTSTASREYESWRSMLSSHAMETSRNRPFLKVRYSIRQEIKNDYGLPTRFPLVQMRSAFHSRYGKFLAMCLRTVRPQYFVTPHASGLFLVRACLPIFSISLTSLQFIARLSILASPSFRTHAAFRVAVSLRRTPLARAPERDRAGAELSLRSDTCGISPPILVLRSGLVCN